MAKLMPAGVFPKRKSNAQPSRMTMVQKRLGLFFIQASMKAFPSIVLLHLRSLSKGITIFRFWEPDYSFIRIGIPLLTSKITYDILLLLPGGKQTERR